MRRYNIDVAVAAAALGVDDILYDYVRRPGGPLESMTFPGLQGTPEASLVAFLTETRAALGSRTFLGASVFGIAVTRPEEIAQDVPAMAREVDYIAPMVYPSHWGRRASTATARTRSRTRSCCARSRTTSRRSMAREPGSCRGCRTSRSEPNTAPPRYAIRSRRHAQQAHEFLQWDPAVTYTARALDAGARFPTVGEKPSRSGRPAFVLAPNEAGVVPVLMFHQILPEGGGDFDLTPAEFRAELARLYREGYRPVKASDLVNGTLDVPRGTTPVVLTFDDATNNQAALLEDGRIDPDTAVGIMLEFARSHPGFEPAGTFYVNRAPFAAEEQTEELLRQLTAVGFELGNHTRDHIDLSTLRPRQVQEQIVRGSRAIREYLPEVQIETLALPFGSQPLQPELASSGRWDGERYEFKGVVLVGAEPAPSPFTSAFDSAAIPRASARPRIVRSRTDPPTGSTGCEAHPSCDMSPTAIRAGSPCRPTARPRSRTPISRGCAR